MVLRGGRLSKIYFYLKYRDNYYVIFRVSIAYKDEIAIPGNYFEAFLIEKEKDITFQNFKQFVGNILITAARPLKP